MDVILADEGADTILDPPGQDALETILRLGLERAA